MFILYRFFNIFMDQYVRRNLPVNMEFSYCRLNNGSLSGLHFITGISAGME